MSDRTAILARTTLLAAVACGALAAMEGVTRALAQASPDSPRCAQMVNVAACNCALQNGGAIRPDGRGFSDGRGPAARTGYVACMKQRGRSAALTIGPHRGG